MITMDDLETYRSSLSGQRVQKQAALEQRVACLEKQLLRITYRMVQ